MFFLEMVKMYLIFDHFGQIFAVLYIHPDVKTPEAIMSPNPTNPSVNLGLVMLNTRKAGRSLLLLSC